MKCPKCGSELREHPTFWFCMNPDCVVQYVDKKGHEEKVGGEKR